MNDFQKKVNRETLKARRDYRRKLKNAYLVYISTGKFQINPDVSAIKNARRKFQSPPVDSFTLRLMHTLNDHQNELEHIVDPDGARNRKVKHEDVKRVRILSYRVIQLEDMISRRMNGVPIDKIYRDFNIRRFISRLHGPGRIRRSVGIIARDWEKY